MRFTMILILTTILLMAGCSGGNPVIPDRHGAAVIGDYTFITGLTSATSWGNVYYNANKIGTGYGMLPVKCGDYVYYITYSGYYPTLKTEPVKYNLTTGMATSLGTPSTTIMGMWNKIDACADGTYLVGSFGTTKIKHGWKSYTLSYAINAELSDDGNYVFYVQNNKEYRKNLNTGATTLLCSVGYGCEVSTNTDGSKAIMAVQSGGAYNLYLWNGSGLTTIGTGYAYYQGLDMGYDGAYAYSVNGKVYTGTSLVGTGTFPAIGADGILYGNGGVLMLDGQTIASYSTAVMQCQWAK